MVYVICFIFIVICGIIVEYLRYKRKIKNVIREGNSSLVTTGHKIEVDLEFCEIVERKFSVDNNAGGSLQVRMLDGIYGNSKSEVDEIDGCYLVYRQRIDQGQFRKYVSPPIFLSAVTLRLRITKHPKTFIYVDNENSEKYYFDVSILMEP